MHLKHLTLKGFRCYDHKAFCFEEGVNLILGPNGIGKTNLLEAIHLFFAGRSFRCSMFKELIQEASDSFELSGTFQIGPMSHHLGFYFDGDKKKLTQNKKNIPTLSAWLGMVHGVTLSPEDRLLIKGSTSQRRLFLDTHLSQIDPLYLHHLSRYHQAMKQRNFLLKQQKKTGLEEIETLMSVAGHYIIDQRTSFINQLEKEAYTTFKVFGFEDLDLKLQYQRSAKSCLQTLLKHNRISDSRYGFTTQGIHRDELLIFQGAKLARFTASEGQVRCLVTALKLAVWSLLQQENQALLCIDDLDLSLDEKRRDALYANLPEKTQVIITSADMRLAQKQAHTIVLDPLSV